MSINRNLSCLRIRHNVMIADELRPQSRKRNGPPNTRTWVVPSLLRAGYGGQPGVFDGSVAGCCLLSLGLEKGPDSVARARA